MHAYRACQIYMIHQRRQKSDDTHHKAYTRHSQYTVYKHLREKTTFVIYHMRIQIQLR